MRVRHRLLHAAILATLLGGSIRTGLAASREPLAEARVTVNFIAPERYTDADNRFGSGPGLRGNLAEIRHILTAAALRVMASGDTLTVDVVDVDLAGFAHPGLNPPTGLRVVSDVTPPAFRLRYDLRRGKRSIASGEERVSDINFLLGARAIRQGSFAYEDELLRDWARRRLSAR
ncbi:DUF3016 domain-containing protein [Methylobacterium sp. J-068]|uniref:DUF3016 domain-containing protein n=1 Tax=Methylobacterium sp. J-068 TaxID=2836649 RepID=UPI001FBABA47|nr:DUF3016 domain-containing protein [Methylobacterium sp. J-068]MCJ2036385.1 DUF3016 domain-containing protein [Methylobacterium sp. J-068]